MYEIRVPIYIIIWSVIFLLPINPAFSKPMEKKYNRLISEKSPYLLQHADNPVDWYPWGPEAFEKAVAENKLIFLSIGYSTCHWCHVMEEESFLDPEVAKLMNDTFVCIKVDREERPDIDSVYMMVAQLLTGSGGWPLTIIMTPEKKPVFAATYISKDARFGRPGLKVLIPRIKDIWETKRDNLLKSSNKILEAIQLAQHIKPGGDLDESILSQTFEGLTTRFDKKNGGFGLSPKFPAPHNLLFLLRYWKRTGDKEALGMVEKTLHAMRSGGIYDHIGFGFHRYSTDPQWLVPHFEKMLYDQALLAMVYTETYQATKNEIYSKTAKEIFTYILRDMTSSEGAFYTAEDADSDGEEGKFYVWTEMETDKIFSGEDRNILKTVFSIENAGNFIDRLNNERTGTNILHLAKSLASYAKDLKISEKELDIRLEKIRQTLFEYREKRIHPYKDDKILTDWNGLMIAALAKGAKVFDDPEYSTAAKKATEFILKNLRHSKGQLLHSYRDGYATKMSHVDDYAFFISGLIELYETTFEVKYLKEAIELNTYFVNHFWDNENGGFFVTSDKGEKLLIRRKEIYDGAIPSGNSVAMSNLLRLGRLTANSDLEKKANQIVRTFSNNIKQSLPAHTKLLTAFDFGLGPSYEIVIVGDLEKKDTKKMLRAIGESFIPNKVVLHKPANKDMPDIVQLAKFTKYHTSINNKATAYVCRNYNCNLPTTDVEEMLGQLN